MTTPTDGRRPDSRTASESALSPAELRDSERVERHSRAVACLNRAPCPIEFVNLAGVVESFDFGAKVDLRTSESRPDEMGCEIPGGRFVLVHYPEEGKPRRPSIEVPPEARYSWLMEDVRESSEGEDWPPLSAVRSPLLDAWRLGQHPRLPETTDADLVTLDQAAAMVNRTKRCLEGYKKSGLPRPSVIGGGGKPHEYDWRLLRPWLEKTFGGRELPETFPRARPPLAETDRNG